MGFGFNLFFIFILLPSTVILLIIWMLSGQKVFGSALGLIWLGVVGLVILSITVQFFTSTKELKKRDYYGSYVIDRDFFPGKQADWQYNTYRFTIKPNDSIYFHVTNKQRILKTFRGHISTRNPYGSERLVIEMPRPTHHIVSSSPTIYRSAWSFYLVFYSSKFGNVFFRKGKWKEIRK